MSTNQSYFELHDLDACNVDELPDPGFYPGCVERARFRQSANHNRMLEVLHTLEDIGPTYQRVCDYFVLEGEHVSASGLFLARRRLVELFRACGIFPAEGDEIIPAHLLNARVEVCVEHEQWQGRPRLRVVGYRAMQSFDSEAKIPF
ncbi:MAG: hypothetical protein QF408_11325 [Pirellulales bacterium]|nr:hypothetical protein [Pirellulales bacterium]MDP7649926.1 hypothetical protein [Candidatus Thalassarchaeaceae archaeon]